ncbi:uncharacterized protein PAC_04942 [Phialocephala subalpina]|uniref:Uncharacterized protein n=1 Tax=Phialocephala subalpina TaxID=576137 RepID=A0A1L7WQK5_9HELO|nr:uncharacterized protein PAC_04942 [Phialocephala subalpina]
MSPCHGAIGQAWSRGCCHGKKDTGTGTGPAKRPPWSSDFRRTVSSPATGPTERRRYDIKGIPEPEVPEDQGIVVKRTPEELAAEARMEELVRENAAAPEEVDISEASTVTPGGGGRPKTFEQVKDILRVKTDALSEDEWMYTSEENVYLVNNKVPPPDTNEKSSAIHTSRHKYFIRLPKQTYTELLEDDDKAEGSSNDKDEPDAEKAKPRETNDSPSEPATRHMVHDCFLDHRSPDRHCQLTKDGPRYPRIMISLKIREPTDAEQLILTPRALWLPESAISVLLHTPYELVRAIIEFTKPEAYYGLSIDDSVHGPSVRDWADMLRIIHKAEACSPRRRSGCGDALPPVRPLVLLRIVAKLVYGPNIATSWGHPRTLLNRMEPGSFKYPEKCDT